MNISDYIRSVFAVKTPSLLNCSSSKEEDNNPRVVAKAGENLIVLDSAETALVIKWSLAPKDDPKKHVCSLKADNAKLWPTAADYLINAKYRPEEEDKDLRAALTGLNDPQRKALAADLATALNNAHSEQPPLYSNLSKAEQKSYDVLCSSVEKDYFKQELLLPGYPGEIKLRYTKQALLALIEAVKVKVPVEKPVPACSDEALKICLSSEAMKDAAKRRDILTPFYPLAQTSTQANAFVFYPAKTIARGQKVDFTFAGQMTGILDKDGKLVADFKIDFGAGIEVELGTPVVSNGVVTSLKVTIKVSDKEDELGTLGARDVNIKLGDHVLQTLTGLKVAGGGGSGSSLAPAPQPEKKPAANAFEL
jgi:hypothetical protein